MKKEVVAPTGDFLDRIEMMMRPRGWKMYVPNAESSFPHATNDQDSLDGWMDI